MAKLLDYVLPGLGEVASGLFGKHGADKQRKHNAEQSRLDREMQREFAQHGIRWKVADARAAGLHPLSALGASGASFSPVAIADNSTAASYSEMGQNLARAAGAVSTSAERQLQALAIKEAQSRIGETDARRDYYLSEAARNAQSMHPSLPVENPRSLSTELGSGDVASLPTPEFAKAYVPKPSDSSMAEGPTPLWREFTLGKDLPIILPGGMQGDAAEVLESLSESLPMLWTVYKENIDRYGPAWGDQFREKYFPTYQKLRDFMSIELRNPWRKKESLRGRYRPKKSHYVPYEGY